MSKTREEKIEILRAFDELYNNARDNLRNLQGENYKGGGVLVLENVTIDPDVWTRLKFSDGVFIRGGVNTDELHWGNRSYSLISNGNRYSVIVIADKSGSMLFFNPSEYFAEIVD